MKQPGFGFSADVREMAADLNQQLSESVADPEGDQRKRTREEMREAKERFLRDWIEQRSGEFSHRDLCDAFATLNDGKSVQRTFYDDQLQELIDEGVVLEERVGEGERPRIVFRRAKSP